MEVTLPAGTFNTKVNSAANASQNVGAESSAIIQAAGRNRKIQGPAVNQDDFEQNDVQRDLLERTADLLTTYDRALKFEMVEDAGIYQMQVIDMTDGRVVRKIPPDEVLKFIVYLKEQMSGFEAFA